MTRSVFEQGAGRFAMVPGVFASFVGFQDPVGFRVFWGVLSVQQLSRTVANEPCRQGCFFRRCVLFGVTAIRPIPTNGPAIMYRNQIIISYLSPN